MTEICSQNPEYFPDMDLPSMELPFNILGIIEGFEYLGNLNNYLPMEEEELYNNFDPFPCKDQNVFDFIQEGHTKIEYENFQTKEERTDCLFANKLEPLHTWETLPPNPVHTETQFDHPLIEDQTLKTEFLDIQEIGQETPNQISFTDISEKPLRKKPGRKKGQPVSNVYHLWEFIRDLLMDPHNRHMITWENREKGIFRMIKSGEVARLWGQKKKNKRIMTYEKMSRSLRYSRKEGYFMDIPRDGSYPKKLCFRFGPKSHGWK